MHVEELLMDVKQRAKEKYDSDIICGAKVEFLLINTDHTTTQYIEFYGTAMKKL